MDYLADVGRARRRQDQTRRRVGEGAGVRNAPLRRSTRNANCARRRDRARRARGHDRGSGWYFAGISTARAPAMDIDAPPAGMAEWRSRAGIFGGRSRAATRPAIRCRVVRRACQVAPRGCDVRHAAVRVAPRFASAAAHHHHAAADRVDQAVARRSAHGRHASAHVSQRGASVACISR
jgi:hypothetical protein